MLKWHLSENNRNMPWKGVKEPYKIWLSETILQQTKVEQGTAYYLKILEKYADVFQLADASLDELYVMWQGLGYYSRCKNMHETAKIIANVYDGVFPDTYDKLIKLKGIGNYTASAILSFAFDKPFAVIDGNVLRVLSRFTGHYFNIYTAEGKKNFEVQANLFLHKEKSALYNQAIMDLGATICKPKNPLCDICPLQSHCVAYNKHLIDVLPLKKKKLILKNRYFHFILAKKNNQILIIKRNEKDIWHNLYTIPMIELENNNKTQLLNIEMNIQYLNIEMQQLLTHQRINGFFYISNSTKKIEKMFKNAIWVQVKELPNYTFPRIIISFFQKMNYLSELKK